MIDMKSLATKVKRCMCLESNIRGITLKLFLGSHSTRKEKSLVKEFVVAVREVCKQTYGTNALSWGSVGSC